MDFHFFVFIAGAISFGVVLGKAKSRRSKHIISHDHMLIWQWYLLKLEQQQRDQFFT